MRVESLLQREGRGPIERTGPIPLPGRGPRHASGRRAAAGAARPGAPQPGFPRPVDPDAPTDPLPTPAARAAAATVPRTRDPRPPTPPAGTPAPTLSRGRPARPAAPPHGPAAPSAAAADRPRWWPLRRRPATARQQRVGRISRATVLIAMAAVAAALAAAGIAVAAWLSSGSGKSGVSAGNALAPTTSTVAGSAVTSGLLTPGASGTAVVTVTNPNRYPVKVLSIVPNGAATAAGGTGTCAMTGVTFTAQQPGVTLAAGASTTLTLANAVAMSTASETGCQGATFTVPVTVAVASTP
ncbi:hypothetical protein [Actinomycetospora sp. TBRC 11914]|uniref:hypothetical protein n=1 Tax=Actinomycetospora sp. TBRC 11914 TaxID=2729387 RepID=UPI00145E41EF|nr:hypothetical protein [Actinomycetospora sp. TBRC 11914]NMO92610.1 hypothetical protein [Actinomycetospora sp. TBRC 11914]